MVCQGNVIITGFENGVVFAYDQRTTNRVFSIDTKKWVRSLQINENLLASGLENGEIKLYDLRAHKDPSSVLQAHNGKVLSMALNSKVLVSGGSDSMIHYHKFLLE